MAGAKKQADVPAVKDPQEWPEPDLELSPIHGFSTVKPNPEPNPHGQVPEPGPSVVQELGKAKE